MGKTFEKKLPYKKQSVIPVTGKVNVRPEKCHRKNRSPKICICL